jgi:hypothetical protein
VYFFIGRSSVVMMRLVIDASQMRAVDRGLFGSPAARCWILRAGVGRCFGRIERRSGVWEEM